MHFANLYLKFCLRMVRCVVAKQKAFTITINTQKEARLNRAERNTPIVFLVIGSTFVIDKLKYATFDCLKIK